MTALNPIPESPVEQQFIDAGPALQKRQYPKWLLRLIGYFILWRLRVWYQTQAWLRRKLSIERDMKIIAEHVLHHERLLDGLRVDFEAHEEANRVQLYALTQRLRYYEEYNDSLKYDARQLRKRKPQLFE